MGGRGVFALPVRERRSYSQSGIIVFAAWPRRATAPAIPAFTNRKNRLFIGGDHLLCDITPGVQARSDTDDPLSTYLQSLNNIYPMDVRLVLPGHRDPSPASGRGSTNSRSTIGRGLPRPWRTQRRPQGRLRRGIRDQLECRRFRLLGIRTGPAKTSRNGRGFCPL